MLFAVANRAAVTEAASSTVAFPLIWSNSSGVGTLVVESLPLIRPKGVAKSKLLPIGLDTSANVRITVFFNVMLSIAIHAFHKSKGKSQLSFYDNFN